MSYQAKKRPPRGYRTQEHPLPHNFGYLFQLNAEDETKNSTIATIFRTTELAIAADTIEVNPAHPDFAEESGCIIHNGSIIPKVDFIFKMKLSKLAIETDKLQNLTVHWMPIYTAFLPSLDAQDSKTAVQIEDILELQHDATNKDTYPLFTGTKLLTAINQPLSTIPLTEAFADIGLAVSAVSESVAFDHLLWKDAVQYYTNRQMLRKVGGRMRTVRLSREKEFHFHSSNFTNPIVKRGNEYTFCGVLVHLPQMGSTEQLGSAADTTNIGHVDVAMSIRFDEWNPFFEQVAR